MNALARLSAAVQSRATRDDAGMTTAEYVVIPTRQA
jgi:hypothetical protein